MKIKKAAEIIVQSEGCPIASVYAMVTSLVENKYEGSAYHIYVLDDKRENELTMLLALQQPSVQIEIITDKELKKREIGDVISLGCNVLVVDDLARDCYDSVRNHPACQRLLAENNAVMQFDWEYSPEYYADHAMADLWMRYYRRSPHGSHTLNRQSYRETIGIPECAENAIAIAMVAQDKNIGSLKHLLQSLKERCDESRKLEVRILFCNLSMQNKRFLMDCRSERLNIVLYNMGGCQEYQKLVSEEVREQFLPIAFAARIFDDYKKVLYMPAGSVCREDVGALYEIELADSYMAAFRMDDQQEDNRNIMLINTVQWLMDSVSEKVWQILCMNKSEGGIVERAISLVCQKRVVYLADEWNQIFKNVVVEEEDGEDMVSQEAVDKIERLENENQVLVERIQFLEKQNRTLDAERVRFLNELLETRKSFTYKVGRIITFLPRKLKGSK